jgi:DNA helicase IV
MVENELFAALVASGRGDLDPGAVREQLRTQLVVREALEWMWPVLTPAQLLNDLFGSPALLAHAVSGVLSHDEGRSLATDRQPDAAAIAWTHDDAPLLDEARALLGPRPGKRRQPGEDEVRTYGHIVVDEAQDMSPMQLRMLNRRSLNGSMTVVGDIAQSTGQWAHQSWDEILDLLPQRRPARRAELTIGYRLPAPNMELAARVLRLAAPGLTPPRSIRQDGDAPIIVATPAGRSLAATVADTTAAELEAVGVGNVAVICSSSMVDVISDALTEAGITHGQATRHGLDTQVTVVPVGLVKGLELDASVVVEPAAIVDEQAQGMRSLYVALTRATKRLAVVHDRPLPEVLTEP